MVPVCRGEEKQPEEQRGFLATRQAESGFVENASQWPRTRFSDLPLRASLFVGPPSAFIPRPCRAALTRVFVAQARGFLCPDLVMAQSRRLDHGPLSLHTSSLSPRLYFDAAHSRGHCAAASPHARCLKPGTCNGSPSPPPRVGAISSTCVNNRTALL